MLEMQQSHDDLQAAFTNGHLFIRVIGRGSFKVAAPMKQFIDQTCENQPVRTVVIDLAECIGMDSTFMGVLAGLSGRPKKNGRALELINLSEKNTNLLRTLGVDQVLCLYCDSHGHDIPDPQVGSVPTDQASKKEMAQTALQAHQNLVEIKDENQPRFKRVIELLKEDVDRLN